MTGAFSRQPKAMISGGDVYNAQGDLPESCLSHLREQVAELEESFQNAQRLQESPLRVRASEGVSALRREILELNNELHRLLHRQHNRHDRGRVSTVLWENHHSSSPLNTSRRHHSECGKGTTTKLHDENHKMDIIECNRRLVNIKQVGPIDSCTGFSSLVRAWYEE